MSDPNQSQNGAAIELTGERSFTLQQGAKAFTLTVGKLFADDWRKYFASLHISSRQDGQDLVNSEEVYAARVALATSALIAAEGYTVSGSPGETIQAFPNWQQLIPLAHRLRLGSLLASAAREPGDDSLIYPEATPVTLSAAWGSDDDGNLQVYTGLIHYLKQPTDAQFRRYTRAASESRVLGGTRQGETQFVGAQMVAAALYDELIVSVEGYTVNGAPLTSSTQIAAEMDTHHKVVAALAVLQPGQDVIAQTAGTEA